MVLSAGIDGVLWSEIACASLGEGISTAGAAVAVEVGQSVCRVDKLDDVQPGQPPGIRMSFGALTLGVMLQVLRKRAVPSTLLFFISKPAFTVTVTREHLQSRAYSEYTGDPWQEP